MNTNPQPNPDPLSSEHGCDLSHQHAQHWLSHHGRLPRIAWQLNGDHSTLGTVGMISPLGLADQVGRLEQGSLSLG